MPRKNVWTDGQDSQIRRLRTEGADWDIVAFCLGLARGAVIVRARPLGIEHPPAHAAAAPPDDPDRSALPPGHPDTWGPINRGTSLAGARFKMPEPVR